MNKYRGYELNKHRAEDAQYYEYISNLGQVCDSVETAVAQFPAYAGYVNVARCLMFYELYKKVQHLNGHIGDFGTYKGFSFIWFAKLVKLMEPYNTTTVHGFDWFQGMLGSDDDNNDFDGKYQSDDQRLQRLLDLQGLGEIAYVHKMDLSSDLQDYLVSQKHMRFKLVFIDCGVKDVLTHTIGNIWPRIVNGGILILDHYNMSVSPTESDLVDMILDGRAVQTLPFARQPSGYIVK